METYTDDSDTEEKSETPGLHQYSQMSTLNASNKTVKCNAQQPDRPTYARIASHLQCSHREYAIIVPTIKGIKQKQYIEALAELINPVHIKYASRISGNRFCFHLGSKDQVDLLLASHSYMKVGDNTIPIKRLVDPGKRIIISNICPSVPQTVLELEIQKLGIRLLSPITFMPIGYKEKSLSHIMTFRRQVFIAAEDVGKLSNSLTFPYQGVSNRIYLAEDILVCYICKKPGHFAANCLQREMPEGGNSIAIGKTHLPTAFGPTSNILTTPVSIDTLIIKPIPENDQTSSNGQATIDEGLDTVLPNRPNDEKTLTHGFTIERSPQNDDQNQQQNNVNIVPLSKVPKTKTNIPLNNRGSKKQQCLQAGTAATSNGQKNKEDSNCKTQKNKYPSTYILEPIRNKITQKKRTYPLTFEKLCLLLDMTQGENQVNANDIVIQFTNDVNGLKQLLSDVRDLTTHRGIKMRISKLIKYLSEQYMKNPTSCNNELLEISHGKCSNLEKKQNSPNLNEHNNPVEL